MRSKIIKIPLYPGNLCIIDAEKPSELKKFGLESIFEADEVLYGHTIGHKYKGKVCNFIVLNSKHSEGITPGIIAHESLHVVHNVFNHIGNKVELMNDEDAAYFISWIVNEVHSFLYNTKFINQ